MSGFKRRNRSICQKSTIIAASLIRASSFVLAKMALGSTLVNSGTNRGVRAHSPVIESDAGPRNMQFTEAAGSHVASFVKDPGKGEGVDALAEKYIDKVHIKHRSDKAAKNDMANCIPPLPVRKLFSYYL